MPPIVPIYLETELVTDISAKPEVIARSKILGADRRQIFQKIGEQEFEDVVFTPERKSKRSENSKSASNRTKNGDDPEESFIAMAKSSINDVEEKTTYASLLTLSIDDDCILRTERNLESIQKDVENKEKLLADVLNFDLSEFMTSSQVYSREAGTNNSLNSITYLNCTVPTNDTTAEDKTEADVEDDESVTTDCLTDSADEDESYRTELKKLEQLGECSKRLLQRKASSELGAKTNGRIINSINRPAKGIDPQELERHFNSEYLFFFCLLHLATVNVKNSF